MMKLVFKMITSFSKCRHSLVLYFICKDWIFFPQKSLTAEFMKRTKNCLKNLHRFVSFQQMSLYALGKVCRAELTRLNPALRTAPTKASGAGRAMRAVNSKNRDRVAQTALIPRIVAAQTCGNNQTSEKENNFYSKQDETNLQN